jgi:hypothetical protein
MKRQALVFTDSATALALYQEFSEFLMSINTDTKIDATNKIAANAAEIEESIPITLRPAPEIRRYE